MIAMLGEFYAAPEFARSGAVGNRDFELVPNGIFKAAGDDEWVALSVRNEDDWCRLVDTLDEPSLRGAEFCRLEFRRSHEDEIESFVRAWTSARDAAEAESVLVAAGLPAARVRSVADVLRCPQLNAAGYFLTVDQPEGIQPAPMPGVIATLRETPGDVRLPPVRHGEHSRSVLSRILGLDAAALDDLEARGIIGEGPPPA